MIDTLQKKTYESLLFVYYIKMYVKIITKLIFNIFIVYTDCMPLNLSKDSVAENVDDTAATVRWHRAELTTIDKLLALDCLAVFFFISQLSILFYYPVNYHVLYMQKCVRIKNTKLLYFVNTYIHTFTYTYIWYNILYNRLFKCRVLLFYHFVKRHNEKKFACACLHKKIICYNKKQLITHKFSFELLLLLIKLKLWLLRNCFNLCR